MKEIVLIIAILVMITVLAVCKGESFFGNGKNKTTQSTESGIAFFKSTNHNGKAALVHAFTEHSEKDEIHAFGLIH